MSEVYQLEYCFKSLDDAKKKKPSRFWTVLKRLRQEVPHELEMQHRGSSARRRNWAPERSLGRPMASVSGVDPIHPIRPTSAGSLPAWAG